MTVTIDQLTGDDGMLHRAVQIRSVDTEQREITGLGVPYGETFTIYPGLEERFEPGSIDPADQPVLYWRHREVIGTVKAQRDTAAGHEITVRISDTSHGRDAWQLVKDEAVRAFSIGFVPVEWRIETAADGTETIIHTKVRTREFSLVPNPAYAGALIASHRSAPTPKETTVPAAALDALTRSDLEPLENGITDLQRELAVMGAGNTPHPLAGQVAEYRTIGDWVQAVARQDQSALDLHRDLFNREAPSNVLADTVVKESWIGDFTRLVDSRRRLVNTFAREVLPATGMKIEYGRLKSDTTAVATQEKEGDDLAGPGKVEISIESADVFTEGGYSSLSFQAIQRATIPTLNTLWKAMGIKYARRTDKRVETEYFKALDARLAAHTAGEEYAALTIGAGAGAADWLDLLLDAAMTYEENGFVIDGLHASIDQFKALNRLEDGAGNRLMRVWGEGMNQVGELNLSTVDGTLGNVRVALVGGRTTRNKLSFYDKEALVTLESPGAPTQLQDENIINLTKQISLYGYVAVATPFPAGLLPVNVGGAAALSLPAAG